MSGMAVAIRARSRTYSAAVLGGGDRGVGAPSFWDFVHSFTVGA
jgi:hypothetical protein